MLLYKKLNTFVVGAQNILEPVERFVKRHLACTAGQIVSIGDDLLFGCQRQIIFLRKSEPSRFSCSNACADVSLNDQHQLIRKTELARNFNTDDSMIDTVGPGPADVMKETALSDQFPVKRSLDTPGKGNRTLGNSNAMSDHISGATGSD